MTKPTDPPLRRAFDVWGTGWDDELQRGRKRPTARSGGIAATVEATWEVQMSESPNGAATPQRSSNTGLKILLILIGVATVIYTWQALSAQVSMAINTIVWVGAIALMIYLFFKIRDATD